MGARIHADVAAHESEHKAERVARVRLAEAEAGRPHGRLGYGWTEMPDGCWVIDDHQAGVLREIAQRILGGETMNSIVRDLNKREEPTPTGLIGKWRTGNMRDLITTARLCGWRQHTTEKQRKAGHVAFAEMVAEGRWPPIFDRALTEELRRYLGDPARRTARPVSQLLVGTLRCGRCGSRMRAMKVPGASGARHRYCCQQQPGTDSCGGIVIVGPQTDDYVVGLVKALLSMNDLEARAPKVETPSDREREQVQRKLAELAELWSDNVITSPEWMAAREPLNARLAAMEEQVERVRRSVTLRESPRGRRAIMARWDTMTLTQQRKIVGDLIDYIEIVPAVNPNGTWKSERIGEIRWHG